MRSIIPLGAVALAIAACAGGVSARQPLSQAKAEASATSRCWEAVCYIDGWTEHWRRSGLTYQQAEAARANHARNNGDRHRTIVYDDCQS